MTIHNEPTESAHDRAVDQREAGDLQGAIRTLIAAPQTLTDVTHAVTLGQMLVEADQPQRAERWLYHAMKLAPDNQYARMGYGVFLAHTGRTDEAQKLLDVLREDFHKAQASSDAEERDSAYAVQSFIACVEVNLARAAFASGDTALARELAAPWLNDEDYWRAAHNVQAQVLLKDGLDPVVLAEEGLACGQVSPFMVCHLLEVALAADTCDFIALDHLIARADACFDFDWKRSEPQLSAVFDQARQRFAHAVMRGLVEPTACPHLTALVTPAAQDLDEFLDDYFDDDMIF